MGSPKSNRFRNEIMEGWGVGPWAWGSVLVSEGGRRAQNSLTGLGPTEKRNMYGVSGIWKVISGATIVV